MFLNLAASEDFADRVRHPFCHLDTPQLEFGV